jgi:hypothetical protein
MLLLIVATWYTAGSTPACSSPTSLAGERVPVIDVFQSGSHVSITLNYNFSTTGQLGNDGCLAVLVAFMNRTSNAPEAAIMFFHTIKDQFLSFWMIGDPYHQAQHWQHSDHFQVNCSLLSLDFIEFLDISNTDIHLVVLASILTDFNLDTQTGDFQSILEEFEPDLHVDYWYPESTTTTTKLSTTTSSFIPGFTLLIITGVFIALSVISMKKRGK